VEEMGIAPEEVWDFIREQLQEQGFDVENMFYIDKEDIVLTPFS
jgi:hypothetical protein